MAPPFRRGAGAQVQPELAQPQDFLLAAVVDVEDSWRGRKGEENLGTIHGGNDVLIIFDHLYDIFWMKKWKDLLRFNGEKKTFFAGRWANMNDFSWLE